MANEEHLRIIKNGVDAWNQWRDSNISLKPDLGSADFGGQKLRGINFKHANLGQSNFWGADLSEGNLSEADLSSADLRWAILSRANLYGANLRWANLWGAKLDKANISEADFIDASCSRADFTQANLSNANLWGAYLGGANLSEANLEGADLIKANLVETNLQKATLRNCRVYGVSAWGVKLEGADQSNMVITPREEPTITVDNLEVAQFIYLLLTNEKIRQIIDTITSKVVLNLGRFTPDRKPILDSIREELRKKNYSPVLFDFEKPKSRDFIETVSAIAHMARFVIADFTDAKIVLEEVPHIVRNIAVPVKPLLLEGSGGEPVTLSNLRRNQRSLLETYFYKDSKDLLVSLREKVIIPGEEKVKELQEK